MSFGRKVFDDATNLGKKLLRGEQVCGRDKFRVEDIIQTVHVGH